MNFTKIEALIGQKAGLDASRINSSYLARAVRERMAACGFSELQSYFNQVRNSIQELDALIEMLVVSETWFFREREAFVLAKNYVCSEWLSTRSSKVLRILSLPCATGEEPYSIAMTLLDLGLTPDRFCIDAVDISSNSILQAQEALYSQNSFRGDDLEFREHYFRQTERGYQLSETVRKNVNFFRGNLLDPLFLTNRPPYDMVWCRNLLIYFGPSSQTRSIQVLDRLLVPGGLLFLGHAETGAIEKVDGFVSVNHPFAFAYQKVKKTAFKKEIARPRKKENSRKDNPYQCSIANYKLPVQSRRQQQTTKKIAPSVLATARHLANGGKLEEAANLCEVYLRQHRTSAEAYLLLGEVQQAKGNNDRAEFNFQKALYLNPNLYEALVHLVQLKESRGDLDGAKIVWQRIQRVQFNEVRQNK